MSNKQFEDFEEILDPPTPSTSSSSDTPNTSAGAYETYLDLVSKLKYTPVVVKQSRHNYFGLDRNYYDEASEPALPVSAVEVPGTDLREGDYVFTEREYGHHYRTWGHTLERHKGALGYRSMLSLDFQDKSEVFAIPGRTYMVKTPRPMPKENEFGPVSP